MGEDRLATVFLWSQGNLRNVALYHIIHDSRNCITYLLYTDSLEPRIFKCSTIS